MLYYIVRRILMMGPTLLVISLLTFFIIELPSGDYISNQIAALKSSGESSSVAKLEFLRKEFSLDRPFMERHHLGRPLAGASRFRRVDPGQLGLVVRIRQAGGAGHRTDTSLDRGPELRDDPVRLRGVIPHRYFLCNAPVFLGDYGFTFLGYIGLATPNFLLALILLYFFNRWFGLSVGGLMDPQYIDQPWSFDKAMSVLAHLIVPTIVIGTSGTAAMIRRLRANLLDELHKQYVTTGRAKG